jgi:diaminopimelate decarboxylase
MNANDDILKQAADLPAQETPVLDPDALLRYVKAFVDRRPTYLELCRAAETPLYVFDPAALKRRARQFAAAFSEVLSDFRPYFAVKSNNHPVVAKTLVQLAFGLDVSSGLELGMALKTGCKDIVFSGPGKTDEELLLAVGHAGLVTVLMDSFGELARLEKIAAEKKCRIRAAVRLSTDERGLWRKFGIPLAHLHAFFAQAHSCRWVSFCGLQFHTSWNLNPDAQAAFLARLGLQLRRLPPLWRASIRFIDVGGGFWPSRGEWLQTAGTTPGRLRTMPAMQIETALTHFCLPASPIEAFASAIAEAATAHIFPQAACRICAEPGRWLSDDAMHILLRVIDKKADDLVITDGGNNIIGWERFETDYAPVINLSRPALEEQPCWILGSLCTPHDVWGYGYFGCGIEPGDVLLIPSQGAYTYSLRQEFIKALPRVVTLPA